MSTQKIFGLIHYSYDYYEWEVVLAVSDNRKSLREHFHKLKKENALRYNNKLLPERQSKEAREQDLCHYTIERMNYIN